LPLVLVNVPAVAVDDEVVFDEVGEVAI